MTFDLVSRKELPDAIAPRPSLGNHELLDGFVLIDILTRVSGILQTSSLSIDLLQEHRFAAVLCNVWLKSCITVLLNRKLVQWLVLIGLHQEWDICHYSCSCLASRTEISGTAELHKRIGWMIA